MKPDPTSPWIRAFSDEFLAELIQGPILECERCHKLLTREFYEAHLREYHDRKNHVNPSPDR